MTPTEKQKCIAEQVVYGDMCFLNPLKTVCKLDVASSIVAYSDKGAKFIPILRPLSDLNKEITHKGYNNNEPFIPLELIEREVYKKVGGVYGCDCELVSHYGYLDPNWSMFDVYNSCGALSTPIVIDLLNGLHFDVRDLIPLGEAIDVNTLSINPY